MRTAPRCQPQVSTTLSALRPGLERMAAQTAPNGVKTLALALSSESDSSLAADANVRVAVGRTADEFVLVAADEHARQERSGGAYISTLSVLVSQDPFPGMSMAGNQMIWVSKQSPPPPPSLPLAHTAVERSLLRIRRSRTTRRIRPSSRNSNELASSGCTPSLSFWVLESLPGLRSRICSSRESRVGSEIKQGFVKLPLAEVTLHESEMLQQCAMPTCGKWETTETMPRFRRCSKCKRRYYVRFSFPRRIIPPTFTGLTPLVFGGPAPQCSTEVSPSRTASL